MRGIEKGRSGLRNYRTRYLGAKRERPARRLSILGAIPMLLALLAGFGFAFEETEYAFVITTDYYSAAYYSTIEVLPPRTVDVSISSVNTDAVAHYDQNEDMVFVINRFLADNVQIVDPRSGFATTGQYSVGNGSNPHDIRLASGDKAYVTRYEWKTLFICHPYTGDSLGTVDLSSLAGADGIPEMDRMEIVGDRVFVTLNCIDHATWLPDGPGKIAVVDAVADTLIDVDPETAGVQPIVLQLPNPYTELRYDRCRGELVVGCLGAWGVTDGGVEVIDPFALESKGIVATESQLGGDVSDVILGPGRKGYTVVMDSMPWPHNFARLACFDRTTAEVLDTLYLQETGSGAALAGIELNRQGEIYLCDRDATRPCIRIYDTSVDTLITSVDVGVPPYDVAFVQQAYAHAPPRPEPLQAAGGGLIRTYPNPARRETTIAFELPGNAGVVVPDLSICDVRGRLIRNLGGPPLGPGHHEVVWDGKDNQGHSVACGVYFCQLACGEMRTAFRIVLTR